jgi:uncharacterized HAD superfamily protein
MPDFLSWHNARYGTRLSKSDIYDFHLANILGCSSSEVGARVSLYFSNNNVSSNLILGALAGVNLLARNAEIVFITARPYNAYRHTHGQLQAYFAGKYSSVHFVDHHGCKGSKCIELGAISLIDDGSHNLDNAAALGVRTIVMDQPWNRVNESHRRMNSWNELGGHLDYILGR